MHEHEIHLEFCSARRRRQAGRTSQPQPGHGEQTPRGRSISGSSRERIGGGRRGCPRDGSLPCCVQSSLQTMCPAVGHVQTPPQIIHTWELGRDVSICKQLLQCRSQNVPGAGQASSSHNVTPIAPQARAESLRRADGFGRSGRRGRPGLPPFFQRQPPGWRPSIWQKRTCQAAAGTRSCGWE